MSHVIDIRRWLDESGNPRPELRRPVLRLALLIEYGGPLAQGAAQATLVECRQPRDNGLPCEGLLWVVKTNDNALATWCPCCAGQEITILGWEETSWAEGPCPPQAPEEDEERVWN